MGWSWNRPSIARILSILRITSVIVGKVNRRSHQYHIPDSFDPNSYMIAGIFFISAGAMSQYTQDGLTLVHLDGWSQVFCRSAPLAREKGK